MNLYLVVKTMVDKDENIETDIILKHKKVEAEVEFYSMIDSFYSQFILDNNISFEEFEVCEYGDEKRNNCSFEFKDKEGLINLKYELKTISIL